MVLVLINLTALQLEVGGREVKKSRRTEGREGGQGQNNMKKDKVDVRSGLAGRGRERDVNYISRVIHEAYQFLNQKLKSAGT